MFLQRTAHFFVNKRYNGALITGIDRWIKWYKINRKFDNIEQMASTKQRDAMNCKNRILIIADAITYFNWTRLDDRLDKRLDNRILIIVMCQIECCVIEIGMYHYMVPVSLYHQSHSIIRSLRPHRSSHATNLQTFKKSTYIIATYIAIHSAMDVMLGKAVRSSRRIFY